MASDPNFRSAIAAVLAFLEDSGYRESAQALRRETQGVLGYVEVRGDGSACARARPHIDAWLEPDSAGHAQVAARAAYIRLCARLSRRGRDRPRARPDHGADARATAGPRRSRRPRGAGVNAAYIGAPQTLLADYSIQRSHLLAAGAHGARRVSDDGSAQ